jgi:hypothetical protein
VFVGDRHRHEDVIWSLRAARPTRHRGA